MVAAGSLRLAAGAAPAARHILEAVRRFFAERGFVEVDTPALQVSPGLEPHLQAFATELTTRATAGAARAISIPRPNSR